MTAEKREQIINDYAEKYAPVLSPDDKDGAIAHSFYKSGMNAAFNLIGEKYDSNTLKQLRNRFQHSSPIKLVLGAGDVWYDHDWIATNEEDLDILVPEDWEYFLRDKKAHFICAEHVWEHFTQEQAMTGFRNVHRFLADQGNFRIAVPDGNFPDQAYIDAVKPGGTGAGADDHKLLYTIDKLLDMLDAVPFRTTSLEYFDVRGKFHYKDWNVSDGEISRSRFHDERNSIDEIVYTSIIIDCKK